MMFLIIHLLPNSRKLMSQNKYHMSVFKVIENRFLPVSMAHFCRQSGSSSNHFLGDVSFRPNQAKIFIIHKSNIRHALPEVFKQTPPDSGHWPGNCTAASQSLLRCQKSVPQALGWSPGDESETWESWSLLLTHWLTHTGNTKYPQGGKNNVTRLLYLRLSNSKSLYVVYL